MLTNDWFSAIHICDIFGYLILLILSVQLQTLKQAKSDSKQPIQIKYQYLKQSGDKTQLPSQC